YSHLETVYNVYDIEFQLDLSDDALSDKLQDMREDEIDCCQTLTSVIADLCSAGFEDTLHDVAGYDAVFLYSYGDDAEGMDELNDEASRLLMEIDDLVYEYYGYTNEEFSVEYNGESWTADDLINYMPDNDEDTKKIAELIYEKRNKALGGIYLELVGKRNQVAELYGYDNYAEYAYKNIYIRDYSFEDTEKIYDLVKENFRDLQYYAQDKSFSSLVRSGLAEMDISASEAMSIAGRFLSQFNTEYAENFNHMKAHHLYDISESENKSFDSFTCSLYDYSVPFMFISPADDFTDIFTVIHEFGHSNAEYLNPISAAYSDMGSSLDTSEMQSQGMEIMFTEYDNSLLGEKEGEAFTQYALFDMIDSIIQGCLFDEFQRYAYMNPDCTLEELNDEYSRLCDEYGAEFAPDDPYSYDWVEISHNYDAPMYYITYATSAVSVLDLWLISMDDFEEARGIYEDIADCPTYVPYLEAAEECGLSTIFDEDSLAEIAYQLEYYFDNGEIDPDYTAASVYNSSDKNSSGDSLFDSRVTKTDISDNADEFLVVFVPLAAASAAYIIGLIISICVIHHHDKKKKQQSDFDMYNMY
ncbi:MAG: M3 family metallopeptidase, partial [Porcipelethomonas sp.]